MRIKNKNIKLKDEIVNILNNDYNQSYLQEQEKTFSRQELDLILDEINGYYLKLPNYFLKLIKGNTLFIKRIYKLPECKFKKIILEDLNVLDNMAKKIYHMWEKYKYYTENIRFRKNLIKRENRFCNL